MPTTVQYVMDRPKITSTSGRGGGVWPPVTKRGGGGAGVERGRAYGRAYESSVYINYYIYIYI